MEKWEEMVTRQANEYKDYLDGYKKSKEQLDEDKQMMMDHLKCEEASLPQSVKEKIERDKETWKADWGMYGTRFKAMRQGHQKEIDKYFYTQSLKNDQAKAQEKSKGRSGGR